MDRTILTAAGMSGASSLLVDSAVKGTALLVLAAVAALILRRDSAATRHLVWMLAIVSLLAVPALSAILPGWRVLPGWAGIPPESVAPEASPPAIAGPAAGAAGLPRSAGLFEVERPPATAYQPDAEPPDSRPASTANGVVPESVIRSRNWIDALPLVWAIGCFALTLRLLAAR